MSVHIYRNRFFVLQKKIVHNLKEKEQNYAQYQLIYTNLFAK